MFLIFQSLRIQIPKPISMTITTLQLSQMVLGVTVNLYAYSTKNKNINCDVKYHHLNVGLATYASYFLLFTNFFYRAYFDRRKIKAA